MSCYAAWNPSDESRRGSASGGIATLLAKAVISKGGVYFGTRWGDNMRAQVAWTESDVEPFKGSRYVHSEFSREARQALEEFLKAGKTVLFVGTPCLVAGLKSLRSYPNLICVDLLCHGTTEPDYLAAEVEYLSKNRVTDIRFREGPRFRFSLWDGERCLHAQDAVKSPYLWGYLSGLTLREACYRCPFATPERVGDITLGDFIGLEGNLSFVLTNTPAGEELLQSCGAVLEPHNLEERLAYRPGIAEPAAPSPYRHKFLQYLQEEDFPHALRHALKGYFAALPFRRAWKWLHHQAHLIKLKLCQK